MVQARYSPVAPWALLDALDSVSALGGYLLLLAHDVLENADRYRELIANVRLNHDDAFIIMDNGVVELGTPLPIKDVSAAADIVDASCIVTPDIMGSFEGTKRLWQREDDALRECGRPLMKVPQGETMAEIIECVDWMRDFLPDPVWGERNYWGVPRWIANKLDSRIPVVQYIALTFENPNPQIHLLGMSKVYDDDMRCTLIDDVMGIDSANPLVLGFAGINLEQAASMYVRHLPRGSYWEMTGLPKTSIDNVRYMHRVVGRR